MTVSIPKWVLYGVVLIFVLSFVTACGGGGGKQQQTEQPASQPSPPTTEQPAQPPVQTEEAQLIERGQQLSISIGCTACHSADGSPGVGPTWKGLYGHEVEVILPDGTETQVIADEEYLRESILNPNAKITKGFGANLMPIYQGQLSEEDITAIIAYIKSLQGEHAHE